MLRTILLATGGIIAVAVAWIAFSIWTFSHSIDAEFAALEASAKPNAEVVSEERVAQLPPPVARHLRQAGVVGQKIPTLVHITQTGRMRSAPDAGWMDFQAVETYSTNPPGFVWRADFPSRALPVLFGRDHYIDGDGRITMKLLGTLAVADIGGSTDLNTAALMRFLNEAMWFPAALAGSNLVYTPIDDDTVEVTLADHGLSATARLYFDADGKIVNFSAKRLNLDANSIQTWQTPVGGYETFNGITVASGGQAVWQTPDGPFAYIELKVTSIAQE
ncbi:MAG: hypothetical protein KKH72_00085 [Alphaproteobacteria bacterium]|nr:hypothetical protein [Alphaproteobacteria bacterium]